MPRLGPIKRRDLVRYLRKLGFGGPHAGGGHQYMAKGKLKLRIPNPHQGDIGRDLLDEILQEGGISKDDWQNL